MLELSVAICTHNPRADYLTRSLAGLRAQTLDLANWELVLVDNASTPPLANSLVDWHPQGRVVREEQLGLTPARLRAITDARAELLVLVDDDNVLAPDYLFTALELAHAWPKLGAWGGQTRPVFEQAPIYGPSDKWLWLAIREFEHDRWSNNPQDGDCYPFGAGLCARRLVLENYVARVAADPIRRSMDRTGDTPLGCGDTDLILTAFDLGLGAGIFSALQLDHLIPPGRLDESYLLRLVEGTVYSSTLLLALRGKKPPRATFWSKLRRWDSLRRLSPRDRTFERARDRGLAAAALKFDSLTQGGLVS